MVKWATTPQPAEAVQSQLRVDLVIGVKFQLALVLLLLLEQVAVHGHGVAIVMVGWEITLQQAEVALFLLWVDLVIGVKFQLVGMATLLL